MILDRGRDYEQSRRRRPTGLELCIHFFLLGGGVPIEHVPLLSW